MSEIHSLLCHMVILLDDGSTAENTRANNKPVRLNIGDDSLSPAFEAALSGLHAGDKHSFTLSAVDAFGEVNPDNIYYLDRTRFPADMVLEPGVIVGFAAANGAEIPGIVREVAGDSVTVDMNHPLAGQTLTFQLEVLQELDDE
ncbi:FKBP-type peptidyl-prolyl cis-trans isomerase [Shewanella dokdonensis]|uniref:Peptidyl-prolyl cis-trans isomerase n=1 Tax=Shewanella dokdonensis TaxID=712036 RepID=A0ABX8DHB7_9GAMM|nr:FKBP-type peptidyl-prolyl cis-trans isomerase [Shewanella dokdonensis]MCL1074026.1 FKBP-type peptidyl-prolyl cis-trans isomerase [Shewanella dokdonensis]QVK23780.1 FKBP-type peptidyl-prolyl cis-trans isomerase [Shewanella dokdonensis]